MARASVPSVDSLTGPTPSGGLTFLQPNDDPTPSEPSPSAGPSEPTTSPSDLPAGWPSETGSDDELPSDRGAAPRTSSRGSSGSALSKRTLREAVRRGVLTAGAVAHTVLAREQAQQDVGLYLADEDDAEAIGDPLANIAHRHGGIGDAGNPDVADAIAALVGLALYAAKQFARLTEARRAHAEATTRRAVPEDAGEPAEAGSGPYSA